MSSFSLDEKIYYSQNVLAMLAYFNQEVLYPFLKHTLPKIYGQTWEAKVERELLRLNSGYHRVGLRKIIEEKGSAKLLSEDPQASIAITLALAKSTLSSKQIINLHTIRKFRNKVFHLEDISFRDLGELIEHTNSFVLSATSSLTLNTKNLDQAIVSLSKKYDPSTIHLDHSQGSIGTGELNRDLEEFQKKQESLLREIEKERRERENLKIEIEERLRLERGRRLLFLSASLCAGLFAVVNLVGKIHSDKIAQRNEQRRISEELLRIEAEQRVEELNRLVAAERARREEEELKRLELERLAVRKEQERLEAIRLAEEHKRMLGKSCSRKFKVEI